MEYLVSAGIVRDGVPHGGARSHAEIRRELGDENPYVAKSGDLEGFVTSEGRFLSRYAAIAVAIRAGQLPETFSGGLLSSDVSWDGHQAKRKADRMASARSGWGKRRRR